MILREDYLLVFSRAGGRRYYFRSASGRLAEADRPPVCTTGRQGADRPVGQYPNKSVNPYKITEIAKSTQILALVLFVMCTTVYRCSVVIVHM